MAWGVAVGARPLTPPHRTAPQDIVDKFQYASPNPDLGTPATTKWVE